MSICYAQIAPAADSLTILNPCLGWVLNSREAAEVADLTARLERGEEPADESVEVAAAASSIDKLTIAIPLPRCEDGPRKVSANDTICITFYLKCMQILDIHIFVFVGIIFVCV